MAAKGTRSFWHRFLLEWSVIMSIHGYISCRGECDFNITALEVNMREEMRDQQNEISTKQEEIISREQQRLQDFRDLQGKLISKLYGIEAKTELGLKNALDPNENATMFFSSLEEVKELVKALGQNIAAITPGPRSCEEVQRKRKELGYSVAENGIHGIFVRGKLVWAFCDFNTEGGNWTVMQRRQDNATNFFRKWDEFRDGFGHPGWNYWLGNEPVHELTSVGNHTLRIEMKDFNDRFYFIEYFGFSVGSEDDMYPLSLGGVARGNVTDALSNIHDGKAFGARDKFRNYGACLNCPSYCHGGWWYECCYYSNLNGRLENDTENVHELARWYDFDSRRYIAMKETEMKIRSVF